MEEWRCLVSAESASPREKKHSFLASKPLYLITSSVLTESLLLSLFDIREGSVLSSAFNGGPRRFFYDGTLLDGTGSGFSASCFWASDFLRLGWLAGSVPSSIYIISQSLAVAYRFQRTNLFTSRRLVLQYQLAKKYLTLAARRQI